MNKLIIKIFERFNLTPISREQINKMAAHLAKKEEDLVELQNLVTQIQTANQKFSWIGEYLEWTEKLFGIGMFPVDKNTKLIASFTPGSSYFKLASKGIGVAELAVITDLLSDIQKNNVPGEVVEFGVFKGEWINRLYNIMGSVGLHREIWGFDSFKGLSKPSEKNDDPFWQEGMFCAGLDEVKRNVQIENRPNIRLVPDWFAESLKGMEARLLEKVSFARIDCDIYEPTVECLQFLESRLSHGSVLVFDDWSHDLRIGETKAFAEWVPTVPHLEFEFLFFSHWDHFQIRVWHVGKPRWPLGTISDRS